MAKKTVVVTQYIDIEYDETKFTPEWMANFREYMYPFHEIDDHLKHLAQVHARGLADQFEPFVEGYGKLADMGIKMDTTEQEEEVED